MEHKTEQKNKGINKLSWISANGCNTNPLTNAEKEYVASLIPYTNDKFLGNQSVINLNYAIPIVSPPKAYINLPVSIT